jgi:hypothetical protein
MTNDTIAASRKRMFFALYLDLILFLVVWGLANFLIGGDAHFGAGVIAFIVIRSVTWKLGVSPGQYFLSIGRDRLVDANLYSRENWLTMLLGALFVLEGTKLLVNWTRGVVPEPSFGLIPSDTARVAIDMISGILLVLVGFFYLKLRPLGFWLALLVVVASLVSTVISWSLLVAAVPNIVLARRAAQGRVPSDGEVQFMQAFLPSITVALLLCLLVAVVLTYSRFFPRGIGLTGSDNEKTVL